MKANTDHIVMKPPATFMCLHCGGRYDAAMPAPVDVFVAIGKGFEKGHKKCPLPGTGLVCEHCGGRDHPKGQCSRLEYDGDPHRWAAGPDTGLSSLTIWSTLMGRPNDRPSYPYDPSDFGRCYRLLHAIPGWRERIGEMAAVPGWERLASAWDELEAIYRRDLASGVSPALYKRIQELTSERRGEDPEVKRG